MRLSRNQPLIMAIAEVEDPYHALGVSKTATQDEIRNAYRNLAKKHHPDLNPGNPKAEERFKQVSAANEILSDPVKRGQFDRGEIDAIGQPRAQRPSYRDYAEGEDGHRYDPSDPSSDDWGGEDFSDLFNSIFTKTGRSQSRPSRQGLDQNYKLACDFLDAVNGTTRRLTLPYGRVLDVKIPAGTDSGQVLRLRGQGGPGTNGRPNGDALIEIQVSAHRFYTREGQNIRLTLPISLSEAVLGGPVPVPTPGGPVQMRIPPHSDGGTELRLRGRGVPAHGTKAKGDFYATLRLVLGEPDTALSEFFLNWKPEHPANPRLGLETSS